MLYDYDLDNFSACLKVGCIKKIYNKYHKNNVRINVLYYPLNSSVPETIITFNLISYFVFPFDLSQFTLL